MLLAILQYIRHKVSLCLKDLKNFKAENKGFLKDPLVYLGIFLIIFLSGALIFSPKLNQKPFSSKNLSFLMANVSTKIPSQNLFVEPVKNIYKEPSQTAFLQQNSIIATIPPVMVASQTLASLIGGDESEQDNGKSIIEYIVGTGDSFSSIASKFNISLETILWANDLNKNSVIKPGQKLIILPGSGVLYYVKKGDTLSAIAQTYKGDIKDIIDFNDLSGEGDIFVGDILIIPNGKIPIRQKPSSFVESQIPIGSSYFICPHSACKITQRLHWYNAVDFGGQCSSPIYAAAAGIIQKVKYGWNGGVGNYLAILHPNGVVTIYGHISASLVNPGQEVSQGQIIALMGGKPGTPGAGISTGCHVHFDVRGGRNPFSN